MILKENFFEELIEPILLSADTFKFHLNDLPDVNEYTPPKEENHNKKSIRHHEKFIDLFNNLDLKKNSCLYWFELAEEKCCAELIDKLDMRRDLLKQNLRMVPVKNKNSNSKYLYVGIRRGGWTQKWKLSNISGRIIQHLGYYRVGITQGLQLAHWANDSDFEINLRVIEFEPGFPNSYLEALEKIIAHKLMPLCGKH